MSDKYAKYKFYRVKLKNIILPYFRKQSVDHKISIIDKQEEIYNNFKDII